MAVFYTRGMYAAHDLLDRFKSTWARLIVAGLVVASLNIVFRADLWGEGHETVNYRDHWRA